MCKQSDINNIIQRIASSYKDIYGENLVKILLYGSYARGDFNEFSDVDIVAIVSGERPELQRLLKQIWDFSSELELEYDVILSPTVIPYDEFERFRNEIPYYMNIEREGVEIVA